MDKQSIITNDVALSSSDLIYEIIKYDKYQGVDFEVACRMLTMMYDDGVHLEGGYDE